MSNLKLTSFSISRAIAGDPVCTMDGRSVKILSYHPDAVDAPVTAIIEGVTYPTIYRVDGRAYYPQFPDRVSNDSENIFMAPKIREVWVNLYPHRTIGGQSLCLFEEAMDEEHANLLHDAIVVATEGPVSKPISRLGNKAHKIIIE